ncbi:hypothetical protein GCM10010840_23450 [Deinococcus aerolatus]|uniref:Methyltransferase domain-containing protein n=1 Tax=Deinococcus aerolatus TaxID=522487 RepID=A0ABQ2GBF1_9DEIO|nr:hypothetical protein GCM10010840_23450 [Deinococcus aerolatus]
MNASTILDVDCGTGVLTRRVAATPGRQLTGVDPAPATLAYARQQPGAERVRWVEGASGALDTPGPGLT